MIIDPELLQALEIFKHFFDLIHQPMAIIDKEGKYIYYNQESAELDGYTMEQAIGKPMLKVYPNLKKEDSTMLQALQGKEYQDTYQTYFNHVGKLVDYQHPMFGSCKIRFFALIESYITIKNNRYQKLFLHRKKCKRLSIKPIF